MTDSLRLLLGAAAPEQATTISDLARALGLLWACPCTYENTDAEDACGKCGTPRATAYDPDPGTEYAYPLSDYARETARVLGLKKGWGAESGYIGAYGLIWGPGVPTLRLYVDHDDDLVLRAQDDPFAFPHVIELRDGAPGTPEELRAVAERIASVIRLAYT
ncbi:hypothetical protein [Streptomyces microflavus]|uniref:hypothetical protein n=1 Tax=Streptomyces microflavus TaxID=1919 RepID=UPI0036680432